MKKVDRHAASAATAKQRAYVEGLLHTREVPQRLARDVERRLPTLTDKDCRDLIPRLQKCPKYEDDWTSPEGYDYSPDMGVHRYDGGGGW